MSLLEDDIPVGWAETNLVDKLESLIDYRGKTPKKSDHGILTLSAKSVKMGRIDYNQAYYISPEEYKRFMVRGFPKTGDILMTTEAPLGCIAKLDRGDIGIAQRLLTLRGKKNVLDNDYLMYYLTSRRGQHELHSRASGSTVQGIKRSEFVKVNILLPEFPEQKAIANVLTAFDDKIENLRAQNQTLEQTAQTIFKEWFGQHQIDDELPEGWRVGKLGDIATLKSGFAFKSKDFVEDSNLKALKIKDLKGNGDVSISGISSIDEVCTKIDKVQYFRLEQGDIVLAMSGNTTGKIGVVPPHSNEIYLNQRVGKFFLNNENLKSFLYNFLMSGGFEEKILSMGYGSAQPNISPSQIENIDIIFPNKEKQNEYLKISNPIYDKVLMNNSQIQSLTKTRDTLLPKIMSGKLRVNGFKN